MDLCSCDKAHLRIGKPRKEIRLRKKRIKGLLAKAATEEPGILQLQQEVRFCQLGGLRHLGP